MGFVLAWAAGLGIVTYRWAKAGAPPTAGSLAAASGFFALLALLHEYQPARGAATALAFGVDLAAYLQVIGKAPVKQQTGWPPLPINDPTVILPAGSAGGGNIISEGGGGGSAPPAGSGQGAPTGTTGSPVKPYG